MIGSSLNFKYLCYIVIVLLERDTITKVMPLKILDYLRVSRRLETDNIGLYIKVLLVSVTFCWSACIITYCPHCTIHT